MNIQTSRFGAVEVLDETLLKFPSGLVGFPACRRFVVLDPAEGSDYQWFQSVEEPSLAFIIVDVHLLEPEFHMEIPDEGLAELDLTPTDPLMMLAVITVPNGKPEQATANLRAPLVVNLRTRKGKQVILHESIPLRYPLLPTSSEPSSDRAMMREPASV